MIIYVTPPGVGEGRGSTQVYFLDSKQNAPLDPPKSPAAQNVPKKRKESGGWFIRPPLFIVMQQEVSLSFVI